MVSLGAAKLATQFMPLVEAEGLLNDPGSFGIVRVEPSHREPPSSLENLLLFCQDRVSLGSSGYPGTHYLELDCFCLQSARINGLSHSPAGNPYHSKYDFFL